MWSGYSEIQPTHLPFEMKEDKKQIFLSTLDRLEIERPKSEFTFHPKRMWRFDYAWPNKKIALEVEGGSWINGRHNRGSGFMKDMEKYNAAANLGWRIIRCTPDNLCKSKNFETIKKTLNETSY